MPMTSHTPTKISELAQDLKHQFPRSLKQVIVFGSRARGDASVKSDWDCLLVFDRVTPGIKAQLDRLAGQRLLEEGLVLSCIPLTEVDLSRLAFEPFVLNARKEGIVL